jgi:hypothetical protein
MSRRPDPAAVREAVLAVADWLRTETAPVPERTALAAAVRLTARTLAALAPGATVEVRVPPFVAVQCISGPRHTRGTPPNVVETDPRTWLLLATGLDGFDDAAAAGRLDLSGARAGVIASLFPLVNLAVREHGETSHVNSRFDPPPP